jgi:hypothetical protein
MSRSPVRTLISFWSLGCLVLAISFAARTSNGEAASAHQAAPNWAVAAPVFPASSKVSHWAPATNAEMQPVFGRFHSSSYDGLHRLNDRGYLQIEQWTKTTTSHGKRSGHLLTWSYGISQYSNEANAASAVNDIIRRMTVMSAGGSYGRTVAFSQAGHAYPYMTFGERTLVDYARLQSFIALHPGVADAIGMTHCHQRGHLEYPIVVVLTPGVDSAMN